MTSNADTKTGRVLGGVLSAAIVIGAVALGLMVLYHVNSYPRTDDAEILANFIGIAPQVEGPILRLNVRDNQFVKQGDLLYEIDDRPYRYALENAVSEQAALEGQIADERRRIAALVSAVSVSQANIQGTEADVTRSAAAVDQARADVTNAEQGVSRAKAEWTYANNNLHRIEPLLVKQFVTVDQVDRARTSEIARGASSEAGGISTAAGAGGIAVHVGSTGTLRGHAGTEQGPARTGAECGDHARTIGQPARRKSLGCRDSPLQSQQLPGLCAVCGSRHESDDFRRRLRAHRPAGVHTDRRAHVVGGRQLS